MLWDKIRQRLIVGGLLVAIGYVPLCYQSASSEPDSSMDECPVEPIEF